MTLNNAIEKLLRIREDSPLGGDTVLAVSLTGSGIEEVEVDDVRLDLSGDGGALVLVTARITEAA